MASPLTSHWARPSHPYIQEVIINEVEFSSKSFSKVALPPWGVFARLNFPPCTMASEPTYATVQFGRDMHLNLNSDLLTLTTPASRHLFVSLSPLSDVNQRAYDSLG